MAQLMNDIFDGDPLNIDGDMFDFMSTGNEVRGKDLSIKSMTDIVGGYGGRKRAFVSKNGHLLGYVDKDGDFHSYDIELTKWMTEGVPGQSSITKGSIIFEIEKIITVDDPLYPLYLIEHLEKEGIKVYSGRDAQNLQIQKSLDSYHFKGRLPAAPKPPKQDLHGKPCGPGQSAERTGCIPKKKPDPRKLNGQQDTTIPNDAATIENGEDPNAKKPLVNKPLNQMTEEEAGTYEARQQQYMQKISEQNDDSAAIGVVLPKTNIQSSEIKDISKVAKNPREMPKVLDTVVSDIYRNNAVIKNAVLDLEHGGDETHNHLSDVITAGREFFARVSNSLKGIPLSDIKTMQGIEIYDDEEFASVAAREYGLKSADEFKDIGGKDISDVSRLAGFADMKNGSMVMRPHLTAREYVHELGHLIHGNYRRAYTFMEWGEEIDNQFDGIVKELFDETQSELKTMGFFRDNSENMYAERDIDDGLIDDSDMMDDVVENDDETLKPEYLDYDMFAIMYRKDYVGVEFPSAYGMNNRNEYFAEHYRLYHEAVKKSRRAGNTKALDRHRKKYPKMSKLIDAHYTAMLLGQQQNKSGAKFMQYKPRFINYIGKDLSIAAYKDMSGQECTVGHNAARDNCIPKKKDPANKKPSKQKEQVSSGYSTESDIDAIPAKQRAKAGKLVSARREGKGKDAVVILHGGKQAPEHIKPSMIPPAWKKVRVSLDPEADVLVTARDAKGRVKTVYHERFIANNQAAKFARIREMLQKHQDMMKEIQNDRNGDKREEAECSWLMAEQATRPGSDVDTKGYAKYYGIDMNKNNIQIHTNKKGDVSVSLMFDDVTIPIRDEGASISIQNKIENDESLEDSDYWLKSYGASTLEARHVVETVEGIRLQFMGKESKYHDHLVRNKKLADMLLERKKKAASGKDKLFNTDYLKVAKYVHSLDGGMFTPKDLRTSLACRMAIDAVNKIGSCCKDENEYKTNVMKIAEHVSGVLGNTPEMALTAYISPTIFSSWKNNVPSFLE